MRKRLGQHFLADPAVIARILSAADLHADDAVIEIGPGKGSLTVPLAEKVQRLLAIEYDPSCVQYLQKRLGDQHRHIQIIHADARTLNYAEFLLAQGFHTDRRVKLLANLPYYAAVPILLSIFRASQQFSQCTLMFQKEVGERITATPGQKAYGFLSVTAQYYSEPVYCFSVPPEAFRPPPKVESAVVKLSCFDHPPIRVIDQEHFFQVVKYAFSSRRKMLKNALIKQGKAFFSADVVSQVFEKLHLSSTIRGEELSVQDFAALSNELLHISNYKNTI